jgi:hypothetical protein
VTPEVQRSLDPVKLGDWKVPIRFGDRTGDIRGRFEYKPILGTYESILKSPKAPAEGVKIQVVSSRTVPAIFLENTSPRTVTVLGDDGEPFIRIGPAVEVNVRSPTWVAIEQARGRTPTEPADADAPPEWKQVQKSPRWSWIELRAAPPREPSKEMALREGPTIVKTWSVPILIGDEKTEVAGITQFVPIAQVREQVRGGRSGETASRTPVVTAIALATVAVGYFVLRLKRRKPGKEEGRRRSRSTPKVKR